MLFLFLHLLNEWHEHELTVCDTRVIPEQEIVLLAQIHRWVRGQDTTWDPATVSAHRKSWTKSFIFLFCAIPVQVAPRPYSIQTLGYIYTPHPVHLFRFFASAYIHTQLQGKQWWFHFTPSYFIFTLPNIALFTPPHLFDSFSHELL